VNTKAPQEGDDILCLWTAQLQSIPDSHAMFFELTPDLGEYNYRLAKTAATSSSQRGAKACWSNLLNNMYNMLQSKIYHSNHCILHLGTKNKRGGRYRTAEGDHDNDVEVTGYVHVAFGSERNGEKAKQKHRNFHCILWLLFHPDCLATFEKKANDLHVSHFCHRGSCGNVWDHLDLAPERFNYTQNGCLYGSALTCPHRPKRCIFVDIQGRPLPCLNNLYTMTASCEHQPNCFLSRLIVGAGGQHVITYEVCGKRKAAIELALF